VPRGLTLKQNIKAMPPAAWVLFGGTFVNRFGSFVFVFLVLYLRQQGYSIAEAGLAVSAYGVGTLLASLAGGYLADRLGRRNSIALSMFSSAGTMLALSQAPSLGLILVLTALAGLTSELYRPASAALIADLTPPGQRVTAFALYRLAINSGFAAGPVVAGLLAERSFFLVFLGDAVTSAVFGALALAALPEGVRVRRREEERGATRAILADRTFLLFLVASVAGAFVYFQSASTFPLHVLAHGHSKAVYGALISLNGLVIVFAELPLTAITQRLPARPVMAAGSALVGIGFGLTAIAAGVPALAATVLIWTVGEIVFAPVASAYVADLSPERLRGRYSGAWSLTWGLGLILGPSLGTLIYRWSDAAVWLLCLGLSLLAAALLLAGPRRARVVPEPVVRSP
jgi:MFS family permease